MLSFRNDRTVALELGHIVNEMAELVKLLSKPMGYFPRTLQRLPHLSYAPSFLVLVFLG